MLRQKRDLWGCIFCSMAQRWLVGQSLLWTSNQPNAQACTWQHPTITGDRHMALAGFEPAISKSERPQNQASDRASTGIGSWTK